MAYWVQKNGATVNVKDTNQFRNCAVIKLWFHLKGKARLFRITAAVESFAKLVENNCKENLFLVELFSEFF